MFRHRVNEFEVVLTIVPRGPLLIAEGEQESPPGHELSPHLSFAEGVEEATALLKDRPKAEKEEEGGVDNRFVRTDRRRGREPFVPGSSLKGVLRQRAERLARTVGQGCCDPFAASGDTPGDREMSCSARIEEKRQRALEDEERGLTGAEVYRTACPVCRLFGCLGLASRIQVTDGYLIEEPGELPSRDGVGIDRRRGGAREKVKFENEVLEQGTFCAHLRLRNFELWQLGTLAYLLDDLAAGRIRLGHGTHRGMGKISAEIDKAWLTYFGARARRAEPDRVVVQGLGALLAAAGFPELEGYGFASDEGVPIEGVKGERNGFRYRWFFPPAQQEALWAAVAPLWDGFAGPRRVEVEGRAT
jgi:CRISPR-associated RAMP protein (TIGR02581 family)